MSWWTRNRSILAAPAALLLLGLAACAGPGAGTRGSAAPAPSAGPALPRLAPTPKPKDLGVIERYAWQTVEQLGEALAEGNAPAFLAKVSTGFYKGYARLEGALLALLAQSASRSVVVAVESVEVEGDRVSVRAQWVRDFATVDGGRDAATGTTTFLFLGTDTALRLLDYRGDPPFGIPGI